MKPKLFLSGAAAALAAALAVAPAAAQPAHPGDGSIHPPMQPYRNSDGTLRRLRGTITTTSWSGYAVTAAAPYTSASATWQVPNVTYDGGQTPYGYEYVFNWVGVGGDGDATLIQLGTESVVSTAGVTSFYTWYELYPAVSEPAGLTVKPGDVVSASLRCTALCSPSQTQTWQLTLSDETTGAAWTQSFQYQSSMRSAEWVTEPPYDNGYLPLADYDQATYDPVEANGANPNLSLSANGIIALAQWGETSNPSAPVGGNVFSTCWGASGASLTPCTAGSFTTPPPVVTVSLSASPQSISSGQSSTLSWNSTNATSCTGTGFTASGISGSALVSPSVTTSYALTCTDGTDPATAMATVTVSSTGGTTCHGGKKKCG
ncbi:MAG: G1 family glutamic endopeptidase [Stellaceae bacterium]